MVIVQLCCLAGKLICIKYYDTLGDEVKNIRD